MPAPPAVGGIGLVVLHGPGGDVAGLVGRRGAGERGPKVVLQTARIIFRHRIVPEDGAALGFEVGHGGTVLPAAFLREQPSNHDVRHFAQGVDLVGGWVQREAGTVLDDGFERGGGVLHEEP